MIRTLRFDFDDRDLEEIERLKAEGFEFVTVALRNKEGLQRLVQITDCSGHDGRAEHE
jgi:hypothetical protein